MLPLKTKEMRSTHGWIQPWVGQILADPWLDQPWLVRRRATHGWISNPFTIYQPFKKGQTKKTFNIYQPCIFCSLKQYLTFSSH
jgi:hypothetical protein